MKTWIITVFFAVLISSAYANEGVVSVQQQAINDFKACVEQVVSNGGDSEEVGSSCQVKRVALEELIPGLAGNIVHTVLQQTAIQ